MHEDTNLYYGKINFKDAGICEAYIERNEGPILHIFNKNNDIRISIISAEYSNLTKNKFSKDDAIILNKWMNSKESQYFDSNIWVSLKGYWTVVNQTKDGFPAEIIECNQPDYTLLSD